ncbi:alpha/beta-hydrolase [Gonapodya prolifera JEL478]|uniref:Alpha/beta-hydrolase n=1 Tax=Gonapodya prolifera (strain JEL478) TaxID=1344416 RepID=A0A139AGB0_GONPJ|nr:alpha/beta-hydrolase [Gonapodya prolifera JEL478]|eukprot:KXS15790.1 alpha/beta-hydrolase [Gonapodya prolifera JEL478]
MSALFPPLFSSESRQSLYADGGELVYELKRAASADARVVVLVPGMGDSRHEYRFLAPKLAAASLTVIVTELRGTGESSSSFASYTPEDVARDVIAILDAEHITSPVVFVGNSLAGASAVYAAAEYPDRVGAVVTLGGILKDNGVVFTTLFSLSTHLLFTSLWGAAAWSSFHATLFTSSHPPADLKEYIEKNKGYLVQDRGRIAAVGAFGRAPKNGCWARVGQVKQPVLLVCGDKDPDFGDATKETNAYKDAMTASKRCEVRMVPENGHYPHVEDPDIVFGHIMEFLKSEGVGMV